MAATGVDGKGQQGQPGAPFSQLTFSRCEETSLSASATFMSHLSLMVGTNNLAREIRLDPTPGYRHTCRDDVRDAETRVMEFQARLLMRIDHTRRPQ